MFKEKENSIQTQKFPHVFPIKLSLT